MDGDVGTWLLTWLLTLTRMMIAIADNYINGAYEKQANNLDQIFSGPLHGFKYFLAY